MIEKIRLLFEQMGSPAIVILQTPRAGEEVDNGMGVDFELAPYAIIYSDDEEGNGCKAYYEHYSKLSEFEREHKTDFMCFSEAGCASIDGMIEELHSRDGYEVKWRKE